MKIEHVAAAGRGQGRRKRQTKARSTERVPRRALQQTVDGSQQSVDGSFYRSPGRDRGSSRFRPSEAVNGSACEVCQKRMKAGHHGERKRFCSLDCRRLAWAARSVVEAIQAGRAPGLRELIERLKVC
jgi:hypothetical protein